MPGAILTEILHPFGRAGGLSSTGATYGTTVSTAGSTSFIAVEEVTLSLPNNVRITELECGLTIGLGITVTTDSPKVTYNIKDNAQSSYDTLKAFTSTTLVSLASTGANSYDFTCLGMIVPSTGTYFTGIGTFQIQATVASNASTSNCKGAMKQTAYVAYSYYLIG